MKTPEQIAQWVIDNRSEQEKVSDLEMYHTVLSEINDLVIFTERMMESVALRRTQQLDPPIHIVDHISLLK